MAKNRKKSKSALPKRIGGVKVPKAVRKSRFGALLASRKGQALLAEALLGAGAAALAGKKAAGNAKVRGVVEDARLRTMLAGDRANHAASDAVHGVGAAGATLAYAFGEAARTFAEVLRNGSGDRPQEPRSFAESAAGLGKGEEQAWAVDYGAPETTVDGDQKPEDDEKKSSAYEAGPL